MGITLFQLVQSEQIKKPGRPGCVLPAAKTETGVVPGVEMRKQGVVLKHHAHATAFCSQRALGTGHLAAVQTDAAANRSLEPGDQPQESGLATTGRSQQPHKFARPQAEIDVLKSPLRPGGAIAVPETIDLDR